MLQGSLLFFDLMSVEGVPTAKLHQLVNSEGESRRAVLAEVIRSAYGPLFTELDITRATQAQIREHFRSRGASGDICRKCVSFFLAISSEAEIPLSPHLRKSSPRVKVKKVTSVDMVRVGGGAELAGYPAWVEKLLEKFPNFDPEWPDELKKKWFDAFKSLKSALLETSAVGRKAPRRR
jgi:hypothetical protein